MSEMLPVCAIEMREKLDASGAGDVVGRPFPGVHLRVADDQELMVSGPNLFRGYLGGETVREHATGDLATLDSLGRVSLLGRKKDMIIRGHDNIYPALVESVVESIPGVRRSCLCGWYDEDRADERVVLVIEPDPAEDARSVAERVEREMRVGAHRIDSSHLPDKIVTMTLPLNPRSRKVERRAVIRQLQETLS
jgi:acyl-CoA synthetase (AMP-forming)/AMP-acid ligase II